MADMEISVSVSSRTYLKSIDSFIDQFSSLTEIDFAIAPGNQADRGEATVRGILSYTGHPFRVLVKGHWINRYGWMSSRKLYFNNLIGRRWLANVDIPDLELFPKRYGPLNTVTFQAGLELSILVAHTNHVSITERKISAGHDVSDGGVVTCLLEMAFAGNCGISVDLPDTEGKYGTDHRHMAFVLPVYQKCSFR